MRCRSGSTDDRRQHGVWKSNHRTQTSCWAACAVQLTSSRGAARSARRPTLIGSLLTMWHPDDMDGFITTATARDEKNRAARVAVLPVGSFEQHGDYLPLITDTVVACAIAERIAAEYGLFLDRKSTRLNSSHVR